MRSLILKRAVANASRSVLSKAAKKTLYVNRPVLNAQEIADWAKGQGFTTTLAPADMHVTIAYSKTPVNWLQIGDDWLDRPEKIYNAEVTRAGLYSDGVEDRQSWDVDDPPGSIRIRAGKREVMPLGPRGAVVLKFDSVHLVERWCRFRRSGCSWDYAGYTPHVTITYDKPPKLDLATVTPFAADILLGEEAFAELDENWTVRER